MLDTNTVLDAEDRQWMVGDEEERGGWTEPVALHSKPSVKVSHQRLSTTLTYEHSCNPRG